MLGGVENELYNELDYTMSILTLEHCTSKFKLKILDEAMYYYYETAYSN
jgi:hypothetical protein